MPQENAIDTFFKKLLEEHKKEVGLFLVGVIFAGGILLSFLLSQRGSKEEIQVMANPSAGSPRPDSGQAGQVQRVGANESNSESVLGEEAVVTPVPLIKVDVAGAVNSPGVCELEEGSRIQDVIDGAGGFSDQSDADWIAKNINLAQKVSDGEKIYIPTKDELREQSAPSADQGNSSVSSVQGTSSSSYSTNTPNSSSSNSSPKITGKININTATVAELDTLPEVGPARAQYIIAARPYSKIEDIMNAKDIGTKRFEKMKDLICVE